MRTTESRLRELIESTEYKKDFRELKKSILASEEKEPPDLWFTEVVDPNTVLANGRVLSFTLKEVQALLKKGNLNDYYLIIPSAFSYFKMKYKLEFFFDPGRAYPQEFDPFNDIPLSVHSPLVGETFAPFFPDPLNINNDNTKVLIMVDITHPLPVLEKRIKAKLKFLKKIWEFKEERKQRYSDDEIYKVKNLIQEGLNSTEIFRELHPEHKSFKFSRDYVIGCKTKKRLDAVKKLQRVKRLVKEAKKRMDKWDT